MGSVSKSKAGIYQKIIEYDICCQSTSNLYISFSLQDSLKLRASVNKNIKNYVNCYTFFVTRFHIVNIFLKCDLL